MTTNDDPITAMPQVLPEGAARPFDAPALARRLLRSVRAGALATLDPGGHPLATLVTVATAFDGAPLLFLSGLSLHTRNLSSDPRASLLLAEGGKGDPLAHPRLSLVGTFVRTDEPSARRRFLARNPKAELYAALPDFALWRMAVTGVHLNGGFARAAPLTPTDLLGDVAGSEALAAAEESALDHLNRDHPEAVALYATRFAGAAPGAWQVSGLDPEGLDLAAGDATARVLFPHRVTTPGDLAKTLKDMAEAARGVLPN